MVETCTYLVWAGDPTGGYTGSLQPPEWCDADALPGEDHCGAHADDDNTYDPDYARDLEMDH